MLPAPALLPLLFLSWAGTAHMAPCLLVKGRKKPFHIKLFWLVADLLSALKRWTLIKKCPCRVEAAPTAQEKVSGKGFGSFYFLPAGRSQTLGADSGQLARQEGWQTRAQTHAHACTSPRGAGREEIFRGWGVQRLLGQRCRGKCGGSIPTPTGTSPIQCVLCLVSVLNMWLGAHWVFQAESSHLFFQLLQLSPLSSSSWWGRVWNEWWHSPVVPCDVQPGVDGMICHDPAWLFVLCKPCRGIGTPGAQRGLNPFLGAAPMSCCPPDKSTSWVGEALLRWFARVAAWWAPMWWLLCLVVLWLLHSLLEGNSQPSHRQPSVLPGVQCRSTRECRWVEEIQLFTSASKSA